MKVTNFTFIDLFAGIGGFHLGLHQAGAQCVFACEIDKYARLTYEQNYKTISPKLFTQKAFAEDIQDVNPSDIPDFDILCAGFPCQPFSQAGQKKGFEDIGRGNMFFEIMRIVKEKKPKVLFLENVRNLVNHDNGKTFEVIQKQIQKHGYSFHWKLIKASDHGLPQHRPRVYMVCFRNDLNIQSFTFPSARPLELTMSDIFQGQCNKKIGFTLRVGGKSSGLHDRRNWDTYLVDNQIVKLQKYHGLQMLGFPKNFNFPVSNTQAMKQLGNSVAVNVVYDIGTEILKTLSSTKNSLTSKTIVKKTRTTQLDLDL